MTWTPLEFGFADAAVTIALLAVIGGLGWLIFTWLPRKWAEAGERAERLADPGRCDWCDGFTVWPDDCNCTEPCTFVPLCGARTADVDAELDAWLGGEGGGRG